MYLLLAQMRSSCRPWWTAAVVAEGSSGGGGASREHCGLPRSVGVLVEVLAQRLTS